MRARRCLSVIAAVFCLVPTVVYGQMFDLSREEMIKYTPEWKGERFPDGRPKVPDSIIERMEAVKIEEAWSVLRGAGYENQFVDGFKEINPGAVLVGRAVTALYIPKRADVEKIIMDANSVQVQDFGYGIHYSESATTLGCIRVAVEENIQMLADMVQSDIRLGKPCTLIVEEYQ